MYHNIPGARKAYLFEMLCMLKPSGTFVIQDIFSKSKRCDMQVLARRLKEMGYHKLD